MHETCSCIEKVINNYVLIKRSYGLIYWKAKLAFATKVASASEGGAGGSRTRVQTWKQYGFYMLIPGLFFMRRLDLGLRPAP